MLFQDESAPAWIFFYFLCQKKKLVKHGCELQNYIYLKLSKYFYVIPFQLLGWWQNFRFA